MSFPIETSKFVIIIDRCLPIGKMANAIGHLSLGIGRSLNAMDIKHSTFNNSEVGYVSYLTDHPLIILGAKSDVQIRNLHNLIKKQDIPHNIFFDNMFEHDVPTQISQIQATPISELIYTAIIVFGSNTQIDPLTKKFSLLRENSLLPGE